MKLSKSMKSIGFSFLFSFVAFYAASQSTRPMVTDIAAQADDQNIEITWNLPSPDALQSADALLLYRGRQAFSSGNQLSSNNLLATLSTTETSFTDTTCGFYSWYYTVAVRYDDGTTYDLIIPTVNATVYAAGVAAVTDEATITGIQNRTSNVLSSETTQNTIREKPLPYLHLFQDDEPISDTIEASTLEEASRFGINSVTRQKVKPYIFADDTDENSTGDEYTLYYIIDTFFSRGEWVSAEMELKKFLQTNKSDYITARAQIYTGQSLFFQEKYRDALNCFMQAEKIYPALDAISRRWIQYSLDYYKLPNNS